MRRDNRPPVRYGFRLYPGDDADYGYRHDYADKALQNLMSRKDIWPAAGDLLADMVFEFYEHHRAAYELPPIE